MKRDNIDTECSWVFTLCCALWKQGEKEEGGEGGEGEDEERKRGRERKMGGKRGKKGGEEKQFRMFECVASRSHGEAMAKRLCQRDR